MSLLVTWAPSGALSSVMDQEEVYIYFFYLSLVNKEIQINRKIERVDKILFVRKVGRNSSRQKTK